MLHRQACYPIQGKRRKAVSQYSTRPKWRFCVTAYRLLAWLFSGLLLALLAAAPALAQPADTNELPAPEALADLLEDEQARQQLIDHLRQQAAAPEASDAAAAADPPSLPQQFAELTSRVVNERSEERRVGKGARGGWSTGGQKRERTST